MGLLEELTEAVALIRSRTALRPSIGVVLGSGLGAFARGLGPVFRSLAFSSPRKAVSFGKPPS